MQRFIKILLFFIILAKASDGLAKTCQFYLSFKVLNDSTEVQLSGDFIDYIEHPSDLSSAALLMADKKVIVQATNSLRADRYFISRLQLEDVKLLQQVFTRYNNNIMGQNLMTSESLELINSSNYSDLTFLNDAEILTFAVIEFNIMDDPLRAKKALLRIKGIRDVSRGISPATQYRFERILRHLIDFHSVAGNFEAVDRIINLLNSSNPRSNLNE